LDFDTLGDDRVVVAVAIVRILAFGVDRVQLLVEEQPLLAAG
jgi:hypothetical protein